MLYPIILTIVLFFAALGLKIVFKSICALCFAFAGTWIILIAGGFLGFSANPLILGIYMGASASGFVYYIFPKLPDKFAVFKLPFLLSLLFIIYSFLDYEFNATSLLILFLVWFIFSLVFVFGNKAKIGEFARKIIECCRNW